MENTNVNEREYVICFHCGEEILIEEAYEYEGQYFCDSNEADDYVVCRHCGDLVHVDDTYYDNCNEDHICINCYDYHGYMTCEDCGEISLECMSVDNSERIVCEGCLDNYYKCDDCGEYYSSCNVNIDDSGNVVCDSCYEHYYRCDDCGDLVHEDNVYYEECGDYCYCEYCFSRNGHDTIKEYSYKPNPIFFKTIEQSQLNEKLLFLGVELEVDDGYNKLDNAQLVQNELEQVYCKSDGSLDDGFENVTHPCTLEYHMQSNYESVFQDLINDNWRSHDTSTCGLHVHVNRDFLGDSVETQDLVVAKIMLIMDRLWDKGLVNFTRRKEGELNQWAKRCAIEEVEHENLNEQDIVQKSKSYKDWGRYYALNLKNTKTIEFRLFKGTLKYNTFIGTLQFVSNIVNYAKDKNLVDIQQSNITMADIINYKEYEELSQYAKERSLI